jgi:hypothetical protein
MSITVNIVDTRGGWKILDAYSADIQTSTQLLAAVTGYEYNIKSLSFEIDNSERWFKLFDDSTLRIGPIKTRTNNYHRSYESPIIVSGAVKVQTESDKEIHITIAYKLRKVG